MRIWWWQTTWVVLVLITTHIPSFINDGSPYRTLDIWLFVISQSEQICKWGLKYAHSVTIDHMGSACAPPLPTHQVWWVFCGNWSLRSHLRAKVYLLMLTRSNQHPSIHLYIHIQTALQMKTKWSFQHSWATHKNQKFLLKWRNHSFC